MDAIAPSNIQESTESPDDGTEFVDCATGLESKNPFKQNSSTSPSPLSPFFFKTKSTFVHGQKPPWGWDYVFAFRLPKILKPQDPTETRQSSTKSSTEDHLLVDIDPDAVDDCHKQGDEKSARMIRSRVEILSRLKSAGFVFSQLLVPSDDVILVRISLPEQIMKEKAINLGLEFKLLPKYGGGFLAFSITRQDCFINHQLSQPRNCYFSPAERALIILNVLQSKEHWGCDLNIERLIYEQDILQAFALHSEHEHQQLIHDTVWSRWWDPTWKPPLCAMKDYLGARVSFYFVFVSFYARRLFPIAVISIPTYITYKVVRNLFAMTIIRIIFAIVLVLWTTFFLENWKRRNALINVEWGLHDYKEDTIDDTRVQFEGDLRYGFYCEGGFVSLADLIGEGQGNGTELDDGKIYVDGRDEPLQLPKTRYQDPLKARNMRIQSYSVTCLFVLMVGSLTFLLLWYRNEIVSYLSAKTNNKGFANAVPGVLNGVLIFVFDSIWRSVSLTLTRRENHRTNQMFENSLIYKRFAFQFISNYISLFYLAFIRPYLQNTCRPSLLFEDGDCMFELETQLLSLMLTKATIGQVMELGVPFLTSRFKQWRAQRHPRKTKQKTDESDCSKSIVREDLHRYISSGHNRYVWESKLSRYESTMEDYNELVIQFGYLSLFGMAQPLASIICVINNMIEVRTDAYKVLAVSQRTDADDAADIGAWYTILEIINVLSVATNIGLLVFTSDALSVLIDLEDNTIMSWLWRVITFFAAEHLFIGIKSWAALCIKDVPGRTYRTVARQAYDMARWFDERWQDAFRGNSLLKMDETQVVLCERFAEVFDVASEDEMEV